MGMALTYILRVVLEVEQYAREDKSPLQSQPTSPPPVGITTLRQFGNYRDTESTKSIKSLFAKGNAGA